MVILAIDQGTTGTTSVLINDSGHIIKKAYREFTQHYPQAGWVEHDPEEIWASVISTVQECFADNPEPIQAIGITNQRETTLVWDKHNSKPIYPAVVWQCRRTAEACEALRPQENFIREKTGLPIDAYFSATKIRWILDHANYENIDHLAFGTIDSWLIWKLTGGRRHLTDVTNAARTQLFNIKDKKWDEELLKLFNIPAEILPVTQNSLSFFGDVSGIPELQGVPILAVAGDQQAALFGQTCFFPGQVKNTYGTGSFMVLNTGDRFVPSQRLTTTLAVDATGAPCYALEGSIFIAGAAIQWLRDELKIISDASETEALAFSIPDNGGVYLVPAFVGLGAPHWNMQARGTITGLTRGSNRAHFARAALEAMAYQSADVFQVMQDEADIKITELKVDGGAVANQFLMQFQADLLQIPILKPKLIESTSLGVGMMAGLNAGIWSNISQLIDLKNIERTYMPTMPETTRQDLMAGWKRALAQAIQ